MALAAKFGDEEPDISIRQEHMERQEQLDNATPSAPTQAPETPSDVGGSEPPPSDVGDGADRSFPVPPVPPPPASGPIFSLAGSGNGGPTSFARPGTEAAQIFRSPLFAVNRSTAAPSRFGAGTALVGGASPNLPAGLSGDAGAAGGDPTDDLRRIMALMRGGRG